MNLAEQLSLNEIFSYNAAMKRREERLLEELNRAFDDRRDQEHRDEKQDEAFEEAAVTATKEQVAAFETRIDRYDSAIVEALTDNEHALLDIRHKREALESSAYKLPDGRAVFKTADGKKVLDRDDVEVPRTVIDPDSIPDYLPRSEENQALRKSEAGQLREREQLHEFQTRIDADRELLGKGGMTANKLDDLDAELQREMPDAVRRKLSDEAPQHGLQDAPAVAPALSLQMGPAPR